jgi:hypothetical protein
MGHKEQIMSTLQVTPPDRHRIRARPAIALALTGLIAIGLALLIVMPTGHRASAPTTRSVARSAPQAGAPTAQTPDLAGCFRDPVTHALTCSHAAPVPAAALAPAGYFRDPATHKLLRLRTAEHRAGREPVNHSRGRIIP